MIKEDTMNSLPTTEMLLPYLYKKKAQLIVINIDSEPEQFVSSSHECPVPSLEQLPNSYSKECFDLESTRRNSNDSNSPVQDVSFSALCQFGQNVASTSNCHAALHASFPAFQNQNIKHANTLNKSAPEIKVSSQATGQYILRKIFHKINQQKGYDIKIKNNISAFCGKYQQGELIECIKRDLSIPQGHNIKAGDNVSKYGKDQIHQKITRRNLRQIRPFLQSSYNDDVDISQELQRLENGRYRYRNSSIVSSISKLARKVSYQRMQSDKTVMIPQRPPILLNTAKHTLMVRIITERLQKREIIWVD